jgi:hypothetical protein
MEKKLKRRVNLEEIVRTYLKDADPVEKFIDRQLRTSWYLIIGYVNGRIEEASGVKGDTEDSLIRAIDSKYLWAENEGGVMSKLKFAGFSDREIARIFSCSKRWVRYQIKRFVDDARRKFEYYEGTHK